MSFIVSRTLSFSRQELALIGVTVLWGATFLIVHVAMRHSGPFFFVGVRFCTAGLICLVLFRQAMRGLTRREVLAGTAIGAAMCVGYALQTFGLKTVNSSTSAFLTALYVPIVPVVQWAVMHRAPRALTWLGIALAFTGLILLAGPDALHLGLGAGEIATLACAVAFAGEIVLIGWFAGTVDARRITVVQLIMAGMLSFIAMPLASEVIPPFHWIWLWAALGLGVASAVIQQTMNWAQKTVSPSRATIIYASEPVWGGVFGRLAGDRLPGLALLGAVFIVAGVIVSELKPRREKGGS